MRVTHADVVNAAQRIKGGVVRTPLLRSEPLSQLTGSEVFVKMENLQRTGSFKERGARNALLQLAPEQRARGVVAASAGNHALGLTYHGRLLGAPVVVVMPRSAPIIKQATCRQLGAEVVTVGDTFLEAFEHAQQLVRSRGLTYVHGYDDPAVIAGQGTIGLEILEQLAELGAPTPDVVIVPLGGGGLIAGIAAAVKHASPSTRIFGVEPAKASKFAPALAAGHPVRIAAGKTVADGLATPDIGANAFETARPLIDGVALADERSLSLAVLRLLELEKSVVEGAGAAGLAALIAQSMNVPTAGDRLPDLRGRSVVLPLCGGNIDPAMIGRVIERGLAADARLTRFTTTISDRPGGLARLTGAIASVGASVKDIIHDRAFATSDLSSVDVRCVIETSGPEHRAALFDALRREGFELTAEDAHQASKPRSRSEDAPV